MTAKDDKYIGTLLERYWDCETTLAEEQELRDFFSRDDLPATWQPYAPLFNYTREEQSVSLSEGFDDRLRAAMEKEKETNRGKKYITIRIFAPLLRVAASLLLIVGLGISIFFITRKNNNPWFVETYGDPNVAIKDATYALEMVSDALKTSEEASLETIRVIDDLDIDWSALDSLVTEDITADSLEAAAQGEETPNNGKFIPEDSKKVKNI
ncbi:MAG: hypothetical protein LLF80_03265 [Porphyromonadaceae bacterium]|nr:hypothetical protein [Porphyromonadaceae bacterium]